MRSSPVEQGEKKKKEKGRNGSGEVERERGGALASLVREETQNHRTGGGHDQSQN